MLERDIEKAVKAHAKKTGWWTAKFTSPSQRGVPDNLFIRAGVHIFIEFKRSGLVVRKDSQQYQKIQEMKRHGATVYECDSIKLGKKILDSHNADTQ